MPNDAEVLTTIGQDFVLKIARVVPGAICYGAYMILMQVLIVIFYQHGLRGSNPLLLFVTVLMFLGGTIFLCLDVSDLVRRMQIILINDPGQLVQGKLDQANESLKKLVWTGEMLFIFMLILGDSVVVWRTWMVYWGHRQWVAIPIATWLGSVVAALFELGCDLRTHWAINDLTPSAASVGAETCAHADLSSYTLSYVTNIFCTSLIAYKSWEHRKLMSKYLGSARRKTQVEKILTLLVESGFVYIILYTLQAVPIYGAKLTTSGLMAFNVVNAIVQQAIGMYPTIIIILVKLQKSLWDAADVSQGIHDTTEGLEFADQSNESRAVTDTFFSNHPSQYSGTMVNKSESGDPKVNIRV